MLLSNYNAVQLFVSIVGLLGASLYFYKLNFLTTSSHLIFCFSLLGEEAGIFVMQEEALFLFMPTNYLLLAFFLTISGQLFVTSVFLAMFAFAIDQFSRLAVDGLYLLCEAGFFSSLNVARWLAVFTMIRLLLFLFQGRLYNWFIYRSHILQITVFLKKKNAFIFSILFFTFFLTLKLIFSRSAVGFDRFYLTISSVLFALVLLFICSSWVVIKKQKQQLQLYLEKKTAEESTLLNTQKLNKDFNHILYTLAELIESNEQEEALDYISSVSNYIKAETPVYNYRQIEQLKNRWVQYYLVSALKKCQNEKIRAELDIQEMGKITDDFMMIDAVRCLSVIFERAVEECTKHERAYINLELYMEEHYLDCKIVHSVCQTNAGSQQEEIAMAAEHQENRLNTIHTIVSKYQQGEFYFKQSNSDFFAQFVLKTS